MVSLHGAQKFKESIDFIVSWSFKKNTAISSFQQRTPLSLYLHQLRQADNHNYRQADLTVRKAYLFARSWTCRNLPDISSVNLFKTHSISHLNSVSNPSATSVNPSPTIRFFLLIRRSMLIPISEQLVQNDYLGFYSNKQLLKEIKLNKILIKLTEMLANPRIYSEKDCSVQQ